MAARSRTTFKKRQKELARLEKKREKAAKRMQRKLEKHSPEAVDEVLGEDSQETVDQVEVRSEHQP